MQFSYNYRIDPAHCYGKFILIFNELCQMLYYQERRPNSEKIN